MGVIYGKMFFIINDIIKLFNLLKALLFLMLIGILRLMALIVIFIVGLYIFAFKHYFVIRKKELMTCYRTKIS